MADDNFGDGIFNIPEANYKKFEAAIEKLSKKSLKLTGEPIIPVVFSYHMKSIGVGQEIKVYEVLLGGEAPMLNGWTFVATIDHANKELGNIIRPLPGQTVPDKYRKTGCTCEHCNINRYRRDTFIVEHEDGTMKQVGRTCLKDFLGHDNPEKVAKRAELLGYAAECGRGWQEMPTGHDRRYLNLEEFLGHVNAASRLFGYVPRSKAKELGREPTADVALTNIMRHGTYGFYAVEDADYEQARKAIEWAAALGEDGAELSEYDHNIQVLAAAGFIEFRSIGYASSILNAYKRTQSPATPVQRQVSEYVGQKGDKLEFTATFMRESGYGDNGVRIALKDENGNNFTWFTTKYLELPVGTKVKVTGTVKDFNEYKGVKSTIITRCKIAAV